jgi:DNA-directed RNA polymerase specialized sigma24 family protein
MNLEEIANVLATTTGAAKSALHRGRERLQEPAAQAGRCGYGAGFASG